MGISGVSRRDFLLRVSQVGGFSAAFASTAVILAGAAAVAATAPETLVREKPIPTGA